MKIVQFIAIATVVSFNASATTAKPVPKPEIGSDIVEHGGGCRKSSPPGQCCHMDNRTGTEHCH